MILVLNALELVGFQEYKWSNNIVNIDLNLAKEKLMHTHDYTHSWDTT